jgi:hypothetical protein
VALEGGELAYAAAYSADPNSSSTWAEATSIDSLCCQEYTDGLIKSNAQAKHILAQSPGPPPPTCRAPQTCAKAAQGLVLPSAMVLRGHR